MPKQSEKRKRSQSPSLEKAGLYKILRRIERRLDNVERRQNKRSRCRSPFRSGSETESSRWSSSRERQDNMYSSGPSSDEENQEVGNAENNSFIENVEDNREHQTNNQQAGSSQKNDSHPNEVNIPSCSNALELQEEILSILGNDKIIRKSFADPIQTEVASRWSHILASGLDEETRKELSHKYLPPENCQFLNPPSINPEVKIALSESVIRRDVRLAHLQQQVGASLSAIGLALTNILNEKEGDKKNYIQLLSDAGRLLADIHYSESMSRRELIAINLNKELKETLTNTPINELLFGSDLDNRIKAIKDLEKSGQQLKIQKKPITKPPVQTSKNQGNYRSPFSQKYGARKNGQLNRAPVSSSQRKTHQFQGKKSDSFQNNKQRRRRH